MNTGNRFLTYFKLKFTKLVNSEDRMTKVSEWDLLSLQLVKILYQGKHYIRENIFWSLLRLNLNKSLFLITIATTKLIYKKTTFVGSL